MIWPSLKQRWLLCVIIRKSLRQRSLMRLMRLKKSLQKGENSGSARVTSAQVAATLTELRKKLSSKKRKKEWAHNVSSKPYGHTGGSTSKYVLKQ